MSGAAPPAVLEEPQRRRLQRRWYVYDWASSAFSTSVLAVFLGPYLTSVTRAAADGRGDVHPLGLPVAAGSYYPYLVSLSVVLQVLVLPFAGAAVDRSAHRLRLLGGATALGAVSTCALLLVRGDRYLLGGALFLLANLALGVASVVYNALLTSVALPQERDRVSSRGWAAGYLGGGILLGVELVLFTLHDRAGLTEGEAVRISLSAAGIWWGAFALVTLRGLRPVDAAPPALDAGAHRRVGAARQLLRTLRELGQRRQTLLFLVAYLLFNDGVQTVIALASTFGDVELHLPQTVLIPAILLVQFVAVVGALLMGRLAGVFGAKPVVLVALVVWVAVIGAAYVLPARSPGTFYLLAGAIGLVLGGTQALARSLFSQMVPSGREAEHFSLYEISDRGTSWLGTLVFGLALQLTGSYRVALLSLVAFFVAGFALLARVDVDAARAESGRPPGAVPAG